MNKRIKTSKAIQSKTVSVRNLSDSLHNEMFQLFSEYYDSVDFKKFILDLQEKTHVFLFFNPQNQSLVGFSTIMRKSFPHIARGIFLFSGDTVMHKDYWGAKALQKSFFWFILESKLMNPFRPVYWMLMSKGHKTYLMMRKNFRDSFPNHKTETPPLFQHIQNKFYQEKFSKSYQPTTNLIVFKENIGSVKMQIAKPTNEQLKDPEVVFFLKKNPGFEMGEELACVCEIRFQDFLLHIPKFFLKAK